MSRLRRTSWLRMDFQRGKSQSVHHQASLTKYCRWDVFGQQIVRQLADSLTTAINQAIPAPAVTRPKDADDPAYNQAARDLPFFELVDGVFVGDDGGIDWDKAKGEPGKADPSIAFAAKMLQSSKTVLASLATSAEPSKTYSSALATACEVCFWWSLRYPE